MVGHLGDDQVMRIEPLMNGIGALIKENPGSSYFCHVKTQQEVYEPGRRLSPGTKSARALILGFLAQRTMRNKYCLSHPVHGIFGKAVQMEEDIISTKNLGGGGCCCNKYLKMWKRLWNWIMGRGCKSFKVYVRKSLHCCDWTITVNADASRERKKGEVQRKPLSSQIIQAVMNRILAEMWAVKDILRRFQSEMRNILLETGANLQTSHELG